MAGENTSLFSGDGHKEEKEWGTKDGLQKATYLLFAIQGLLLALFYLFSGSELVTYGSGTQAYNMFIGVEIMM